jgi:hypothetical protein
VRIATPAGGIGAVALGREKGFGAGDRRVLPGAGAYPRPTRQCTCGVEHIP